MRNILNVIQLLSEMPVKRFWRFDGLAPRQLRELAFALRVDAAATAQSERISIAEEFEKIFSIVRQHKAAGRIIPERIKNKMRVFSLEDLGVTVFGMSPTDGRIDAYEDLLKKCFDGSGQLIDRIPNVAHNIISIALLVKYGGTRVVLAGDVEGPGWEELLEDLAADELQATVVKVSHHGSTTGYIHGLWERFSAKSKPIAVVVPFLRHRLPDPDAISHIRGFSSRIFSTCALSKADRSLSLSPNAPVMSRQALDETLKVAPRTKKSEVGICHLALDNEGTCRSIELAGPAQAI